MSKFNQLVLSPLMLLFIIIYSMPFANGQKNLFAEFGLCKYQECVAGSECCNFTDNEGLSGQFCVS